MSDVMSSTCRRCGAVIASPLAHSEDECRIHALEANLKIKQAVIDGLGGRLLEMEALEKKNKEGYDAIARMAGKYRELKAEIERLRNDTEFREMRENCVAACAEVERLREKNLPAAHKQIEDLINDHDTTRRLLRDVLHAFRQYDMNPHTTIVRNQMREQISAAEKHLNERDAGS